MEDIETLKTRLLEELKYSCYPSERSAIRDRYIDTAHYIFKTSHASYRGSFLSFGSRRSSVVSSYGNTPTIMRRSFSSNGMLEYTMQHGRHNLPSITKEEKEIESNESEGKQTDVDSAKHTIGSEAVSSTSHTAGEASKPEELPLSVGETSRNGPHQDIDTVEEEESVADTKNRKIFHHYDMPPVRRTPQSCIESLSIASTSNGSLNRRDDEDIDSNEIEREVKALDIKSDVIEEDLHEVSSGTLPVHLPDTEGSASSSLPQIQATSSEAMPDKLHNNSSSITEDKEAFSSPPTPEMSKATRASSMNEKIATTAFPRKSGNRFSLREFPLRSPTPPKKSPRKGVKVLKERENPEATNIAACHRQVKKEVVSSNLSKPSPGKSNSGTSSQNDFPSLIPTTIDSNSGEPPQTSASLLSTVDAKPQFVQSLDETPLFIVEEEYDKPPIVSPRVGIHSLVSDNKLNDNFIVVHPTNDSNSLGLAPLTTHNRKKPPLAQANTSKTTTHSSSNFQSRPSNNKSTFLHHSGVSSSSKSLLSHHPSLSSSSKSSLSHHSSLLSSSKSSLSHHSSHSSSSKSSLSHHSNTSLNKGKSGRSVGDSNSGKTTPSYLSSKRFPQVQLLKFKSREEEGLFPLGVSNFRATKVRIQSLPLDTTNEKGLSPDFEGEFVNTNSSRVCVVM